jgi:diguanylate cyclase
VTEWDVSGVAPRAAPPLSDIGADRAADARLRSGAGELLAIDPQFEQREGRKQAIVAALPVRTWMLTELPYVLVAAAAWVLLPAGHPLQLLVAVAATALFMVASQVTVPLNVGAVGLVQPAFVLMLFVVPLNAVLAIVVLCRLAGEVLRRKPPGSLALTPGDCWYAVPPTLIIALAAPGPVSSSHWPVYAAAFAAELAWDLAVGAGRRALLGYRGDFDLSTAVTPVAIDICLTPIGLAAAASADRAPGMSVAVLAGAIGVTAMFGRERAHGRKRQEEAFRDPVTGVANRALFDELLESAMQRCERRKTVGALLLLDLNRFKEVNDRLGHTCGDAVLKAFAERISACVRDTDMVARLGGDEFAVLLAGPSSIEAAHAVADILRKALIAPLNIPGYGQIAVSASIGAAVFGGGVTHTGAVTDADIAMYAEKGTVRPPGGSEQAPRARSGARAGRT